MKNNFCGQWKDAKTKTVIEIAKLNKTYTGTMRRSNIGIRFRNYLLISEFDANVSVGGVGVYSPIGDGSSVYALWSSTQILGQLGSGIALKSEPNISTAFSGDYSVKYFVANNEARSFTVSIKQPEAGLLTHTLTWYMKDQILLHGVGVLVEDSLAFAWGSTNCNFDFSLLYFTDTDKLTKQTVKMNDYNISQNFLAKL